MKFVVSLLLSTLCAGTAAAQTPNAPTPVPVPMPTQTMPAEPNEKMPSYDNPYDAYDAGAFEQALHGFIDKQVSDPENPELMLHVGSANYGLANYADAEKSFHQAYLRGDEKVRAQAAYNLGNCTFRQGKLEDAVEHYKKALELNEDDQDAKFNLEFTRDEIRRHVEEAKKQAEERQNQEQQQEPNENQDPQQQNPQEEGQEQGEQSQEAGNQEPTEQTDTDQDGLSDTLERSGENPTDPQNPDTDNDGLKDGEEDMNRNGKVDEGESDPNKADTNGDGIPDGQAQEAQPAEQNTEKELTPEEAQRYLQGLQEGKPKRKRTKGGRRNSGKDW